MSEAIVLINTEIGAKADALESLKKIEKIDGTWTVYGVYDIVARVKADTTDKVKEIVSWRIRRTDKLRSTLTMFIVERAKRITGKWTKKEKAIVVINTEIGSESEVLESFEKLNKKLEEEELGKIVEASCVYGFYDIVVFVEADTMDKLREIVTWNIRRTDKVRSTLTLIVDESKKEEQQQETVKQT